MEKKLSLLTVAVLFLLMQNAHGGILDQVKVDRLGLSKISSQPYLCCELQSFSQPIETFRDFQYVVFYDTLGNVCVGRRRVPETQWDTLRLANYLFAPGDISDANGHNTPTIGLSPLDGTIHLSFDHHNSTLHYAVSVKGLLFNPDSFAWTGLLFGSVRGNDIMPGISSVCYPSFLKRPDGVLQFIARYAGGSPNADWGLWEYNADSSKWSAVGMFLSRTGYYVNAPGDTSKFRCAYPNGYTYQGNRLHITWTWRELIKVGVSTNHDLMYAYSDDFGRTWKNSAGESVGTSGADPMKLASPGIKVWDIGVNRGYINQCCQSLDSKKQVHVITWHVRDGDANVPGQFFPSNAWYFHYWRDTTGVWHRDSIFPITSVLGQGRPKLVFDMNDNAYLITKPGLVYGATAGSVWNNWTLLINEDIGSGGEAAVDLEMWNTSQVLSLLSASQKVLDVSISDLSWPIVKVQARSSFDSTVLPGVAAAFYRGDTLIRSRLTDSVGNGLIRLWPAIYDLLAAKASYKPVSYKSLSIPVNPVDTPFFQVYLSPLAASELRISPDTYMLKVQDSILLKCRTFYDNGTLSSGNESYVWTSLTPELVSVAPSGIVTSFNKTGEALVVANHTELGLSDTVLIRIVRVELLSPVADAYVMNANYGDSNYGAINLLVTTRSPYGYKRDAFVMFDMRCLTGRKVLGASLKLYLTGSGGITTEYYLPAWDVPSSWSEATLTWNNAPVLSSVIDTATITSYSRWVTWDVKSWVIDHQEDSTASLCFKDSARQPCVVNFASKENSTLVRRPVLEILYADTGIATYAAIPIKSSGRNNLVVLNNPFNPVCRLSVILEKNADLSLDVYDMTGRHVRTVAKGIYPVGVNMFAWNGSDKIGRSSASGVYVMQLRVDNKTFSRRAVLIK